MNKQGKPSYSRSEKIVLLQMEQLLQTRLNRLKVGMGH